MDSNPVNLPQLLQGTLHSILQFEMSLVPGLWTACPVTCGIVDMHEQFFASADHPELLDVAWWVVNLFQAGLLSAYNNE
jgi:hypothetical protein